MAAGSAAAGLGASALKPAQGQAARKVLTEDDRIDIGGKGQQIIERAYQLGLEYEGKYGSCSQCVVAALQDSIGFVPNSEDVFLAASCVDGGATPTKLASCGAFTGAGMVIGHICGRTRANFSGRATLARKLIQELHGEFANAYGSVVCRDVRAKAEAKCTEVVANASRWTAEILLKQFAGHQQG